MKSEIVFCKDCIYWNQNWFRLSSTKEHTITDYGQCMHQNTSRLAHDALIDSGSFALDSGSIRSLGISLMTGPDFGCTEGEEDE